MFVFVVFFLSVKHMMGVVRINDSTTCTNILQLDFGLHVALPIKSRHQDVCVCPIILHSDESCYNFSRCNCAKDSWFTHTVTFCKTGHGILELCFYNGSFSNLTGRVYFFYRYYDACSLHIETHQIVHSYRNYTEVLDPTEG